MRSKKTINILVTKSILFLEGAVILLSLLAAVAAKDISVVFSPEENEQVEAEAIEGQFPGMMGMPGMEMMGGMGGMPGMEMMSGMGMMGGMPGMEMMGGMPGMGMMGGMGGMGMMGGMGGMGGCGCQPICRPCMPW